MILRSKQPLRLGNKSRQTLPKSTKVAVHLILRQGDIPVTGRQLHVLSTVNCDPNDPPKLIPLEGRRTHQHYDDNEDAQTFRHRREDVVFIFSIPVHVQYIVPSRKRSICQYQVRDVGRGVLQDTQVQKGLVPAGWSSRRHFVP